MPKNLKQEARSAKPVGAKSPKTESAGQRAFEAFPILGEIGRIGASVPQRSWDELPRDLSADIDHYVYGLPKR